MHAAGARITAATAAAVKSACEADEARAGTAAEVAGEAGALPAGGVAATHNCCVASDREAAGAGVQGRGYP